MISTNTWVAAGSTATLLAGGLFFGAPMAAAAPGDAACLQASAQFNAALGLAGVDLRFVTQFELATAAVVDAAANLEAVTQAALTSQVAVDAEAALIRAEEDYEAAVLLAQGDLEDPAVVEAQSLVELAAAAYDEVTYTDEVQAAEEAFVDADGAASDLLAQLDMEVDQANEILALFEAFLAACDAEAIGVDPAGPGITPVGPAPVAVPAAPVAVPAPPAAPSAVVPAPTGTNKGLNVQTAVATEDNSAAVALIAALLAVGVAVPAATAARMRRLERAQR
ncbi:hypothetical protein [Arthrobacter sp. SX1312]|uniref:hypothetical protein n=1 Tax=Arthrobacter sp. SX1312 TaxID=2058896 RepID=UPI000CE48ADB|nr:hypothetical protein [Arthrobacter sp. SX1312]